MYLQEVKEELDDRRRKASVWKEAIELSIVERERLHWEKEDLMVWGIGEFFR